VRPLPPSGNSRRSKAATRLASMTMLCLHLSTAHTPGTVVNPCHTRDAKSEFEGTACNSRSYPTGLVAPSWHMRAHWPDLLAQARNLSSWPFSCPGGPWAALDWRCAIPGLVLADAWCCSTGTGAVLTSNAQVSAISFGAAPLGGVYGDTSEELCIQAVHEAFKLGAEPPPCPGTG